MRRRNIPHRKISIHALCEEGDSFSFSNRPVFSSFLSTPSARRATISTMHLQTSYGVFLSTPSARRATSGAVLHFDSQKISIHALCEEGDRTGLLQKQAGQDFYPRPLRGGRPGARFSISTSSVNFYPRPLRGGRPAGRGVVEGPQPISIHALCEEGDRHIETILNEPTYFYPRPLRGGRR